MRKFNFSLIELLVVIAVLMVLISLLQPSLLSVMNSARIMQCLNNNKSLGNGIMLFQNDNDGHFPTIPYWGPISGGYGNTRFYGGLAMGPADRPLNHYLNDDPSVSECPSDKGDGWLSLGVNQDLNHCYENYGTSYLGQFGGDLFGVKHVFARDKAVSIYELSSLSNKIVMGDWVWHPNRTLSMPQSRWHSVDRREYNMLFADGHAELFDFGLSYESLPFRQTPDPKHLFW